jgi:hypothetical protein
MTENATLIKADQDHCAAIWRGVLVYVWRKTTRPEVVDEHRKYIENHIAKGRGPLAMVIIIEAQTEVPDGPTREKLAGLMQAAGPVGTCAAMVYEGTGFRGAAVRGVVTVLNTLARQPFPYKAFGHMDAAAAWLTTIHADGKGPITAADLVGVVGRLRASTQSAV